MHRKATRNDAKYSKNKEANKQLVIDVERMRLRREAVRQAEELAGKHDRSGKLFGVSEILEVRENGKVISQAATEWRERERLWEEIVCGEKMSKKIKKKRKDKWLVAQPQPIRPVIPAGYSVNEGEEDFVKLWDLTDQEFKIRLAKAKGEKKSDGKTKAREIKKEQKFNKNLRQMKKEAEKEGREFDMKAAKKQLLEEQQQSAAEEDSSASDSDSEVDDDDGGVVLEDTDRQSFNSNHEQAQEATADEENHATKEHEEAVAKEKRAKKAAKKELEEQQDVLTNEVTSSKSTSKKRKHNEDGESNAEGQSEKKSKKSKKSKKALDDQVGGSDVPQTEEQMPDVVEDNTQKKSKKNKKSSEDQPLNFKSTKALLESNDTKLDALIAEQNKARAAATTEPTPEYATYPEASAVVTANNKHVPGRSNKPNKDKKAKLEKKRAKKLEKEGKGKKAKESAVPGEVDEAHEKAVLEAAKAAQLAREAAEEERKKEEKKAKKASKSSSDESASTQTTPNTYIPPPQASVASQWNATSLGGGNARQDKFLRLLGAGKGSSLGVNSGQKSVGGGKIDVGKMQSDLERQFEAGNQRKHDGGSKRRGLGA